MAARGTYPKARGEMDLVAVLLVTSWVPLFNKLFFLILTQGHFFFIAFRVRGRGREKPWVSCLPWGPGLEIIHTRLGIEPAAFWLQGNTPTHRATGPGPFFSHKASLPREQRQRGGSATHQRPSCVHVHRSGRNWERGRQPCGAVWTRSCSQLVTRPMLVASAPEATPAELRLPPMLILPRK